METEIFSWGGAARFVDNEFVAPERRLDGAAEMVNGCMGLKPTTADSGLKRGLEDIKWWLEDKEDPAKAQSEKWKNLSRKEIQEGSQEKRMFLKAVLNSTEAKKED